MIVVYVRLLTRELGRGFGIICTTVIF